MATLGVGNSEAVRRGARSCPAAGADGRAGRACTSGRVWLGRVTSSAGTGRCVLAPVGHAVG
ncbi:hypothetical protein LWF15_15150, partial [Kineosporia rhizophila]|uniref:hypothetical protein n=1 Tax=Kineosporia rhizophila TaxID=84633 RepID=UPI001E5E8516